MKRLVTGVGRYWFSNQKRHDMMVEPQKWSKLREQSQIKFYPKQHPTNIYSKNQNILRHDKPIYIQSAKFETPFEENLPQMIQNMNFKQPENPKGLSLGIVGAPNAGKSSLFNTMIGASIQPVSNKSNTTSQKAAGYFTNQQSGVQLEFYDTPGITQKYKGSSHFTTKAWDTLANCDEVLFVVDAAKRIDVSVKAALKRLNTLKVDKAQSQMLDKIISNHAKYKTFDELAKAFSSDGLGESQVESVPKILVFNKMDICINKKKLKENLSEIEDLAKFNHIFYVSCETGYGVSELREYLEKRAWPRNWNYNPQAQAEYSNIQIMENFMIQSIYERYYKTIPHRTGVSLDGFSMRSDGIGVLNFTLDVEGVNELKILSGKEGRNLELLKKKVRILLIQQFKRDFEIYIRIKIRNHKIYVENEKEQIIASENEGLEQVQKELASAQILKQNLYERLQNYLKN